MPDANTYYYAFSTGAQGITALIALGAVFVVLRIDSYRTRMQREMGRIVDGLGVIAQKGGGPANAVTRLGVNVVRSRPSGQALAHGGSSGGPSVAPLGRAVGAHPARLS